MSINLLPIELIDHLTAFVATADYVALSQVNTRFYHVVQRHLYRHVHVDDTNTACVLTLGRKPHLARNVRTFAVRLNPFSKPSLLSSWYRQLHCAISHMSELTSLEMSIDQAASWVMQTPSDAAYPRLRRFVSSFHLDDHVAHFLNKADALLDLEIDSLNTYSLPVVSLRANAIPLLQHFTGSSHAAQVIVPSRPVGHIHLNSGDLTEDVADSLAKSTAPILVLAAATSSHSVSLIGTLTRCMNHLMHLRIVTTYNFSDAPDAVSDCISSPLSFRSHMIS